MPPTRRRREAHATRFGREGEGCRKLSGGHGWDGTDGAFSFGDVADYRDFRASQFNPEYIERTAFISGQPSIPGTSIAG